VGAHGVVLVPFVLLGNVLLDDEHREAHGAKLRLLLRPGHVADGEALRGFNRHSRRSTSVARPSRTMRSQRPPTGSVSLSATWPNGKPVNTGVRHTLAQVRDGGVDIVAAVVVGQRVFGEMPEQDRALAREHARVMELVEHALDAVRRLADVLEEKDAAVRSTGNTACRTGARPSRGCRPRAFPP
jgi:hypothetical protein